MFELSPTLDLARFSLKSTESWVVLILMAGFLVANFKIAMPLLVRVAQNLAERSKYVRPTHFPPETLSRVGEAVIGWPLTLGGWLGLFYLFDRKDFIWYVQDALTWWPDYGSATCWAVNASVFILVAGFAGIISSFRRQYGLAGCLALTMAVIPIAIGSFYVGILAGPAVLIPLTLLRGRSIDYMTKGSYFLIVNIFRPARA